jgi:phage recombination protein Bet
MNQTATRSRQSLQRPPAAGANDVAADVARAEQNAVGVKRANALQQLAARLNIDPNNLQNMLMSTVFRVRISGQDRVPTNEEFAALIIVANEYELNPITKEFYAFPNKAGGLSPIVSVDGWIKIMNRHPAFDGIEFNDIADEKGNLMAIEATIYRKDRTRPIKVTEYLDECKQNTDPWKNMPARMLRHKALIQGVRLAFGVSGVLAEDDAEIVGDIRMGGELTPNRSAPPMRNVTGTGRQIPHTPVQQQADEPYDPGTGEIIQEGRAESDMGERHLDPQTGLEIDPQEAKANEIIDRAKSVETIVDYNTLAEEAQPHIDMMSDPMMAETCNNALKAAKQRLSGGRGRG